MNRLSLVLMFVASMSCTTSFDAEVPRAESDILGFGRDAVGGSVRCRVRDADTFVECVGTDGAEVVFEVPEIDLGDLADVRFASNVLVRGETGGGATLLTASSSPGGTGSELVLENVSNVVIYGLRINGGESRGAMIRVCNSENVRINHVTLFDRIGPALVIDDSINVTFSNSLVYEADVAANIHSQGCSEEARGNQGITFARNLLHGFCGRAPRVMGRATNIEVLNNMGIGWKQSCEQALVLGDKNASVVVNADMTRTVEGFLWEVSRLDVAGNVYRPLDEGPFNGGGSDALRLVHLESTDESQNDQENIYIGSEEEDDENSWPNTADPNFRNPAAARHNPGTEVIPVRGINAAIIPFVGSPLPKGEDEAVRALAAGVSF